MKIEIKGIIIEVSNPKPLIPKTYYFEGLNRKIKLVEKLEKTGDTWFGFKNPKTNCYVYFFKIHMQVGMSYNNLLLRSIIGSNNKPVGVLMTIVEVFDIPKRHRVRHSIKAF